MSPPDIITQPLGALLDPKAVAARLGVSRSTAYRLMAEGGLAAYEVRGSLRTSELDLQQYLHAHRREPRAPR